VAVLQIGIIILNTNNICKGMQQMQDVRREIVIFPAVRTRRLYGGRAIL
jgi:hypothetical protein